MLTFGRLVACAAAIFISAHEGEASTLVDWGVETFDTSTNLAWLDLTVTEGLSPLAAIGAHPTYRHATQSEVVSLFLTAGATAVDSIPRESDFPASELLIDLLGTTFTGNPPSGTSVGGQGLALGTGGILFSDPVYQSIIPSSGPSEGSFYPGAVTSGFISSTTAFGNVGVFLVRDATPVPVPAGLPLAISGLGAMLWLRRRRRSRS